MRFFPARGHAWASLLALAVGALVAVPSTANASASGCTGNTVCVFVGGSGSYVSAVSGGVAVPGGALSDRKWCGTLIIGINNGVVARSTHGCAYAVSPFNWTWTTNRNYANNTKVCLQAQTDAGPYYNPGNGGACEYVRS